jgi:hypothetical protein
LEGRSVFEAPLKLGVTGERMADVKATFQAESLAPQGDPPIFPGRQKRFDRSGIPSRILLNVSRQSTRREEPEIIFWRQDMAGSFLIHGAPVP